MTEHYFNPEDLPEYLLDLAEQLRTARFNIGLQQHIAAQDLMIALVANGQLPNDPRNWKSLLAPIFCSNPMEQEQFSGHFESWLKRHPGLTELAARAEQVKQAQESEPSTFNPPKQPLTFADLLRWIRRHPAWGAAAVMLIAALLAAVLLFKLDRTLEGQVFSQTKDTPLPGAEVTFLNQTTTTDGEGKFTIPYQIRVYEWLGTIKFEPATIGEVNHFPQFPVVAVQNPGRISATLEKREFLEPGGNPIELPPPTETQTPPPVEQPKQPPFPWRTVLLGLLPLLALLAWLVWRWIRRRMMLRKLEMSGALKLHQLRFQREDLPLFSSAPFRRAAQELRRHRHVEHHELDVAATVGATIHKGYFTPRYARRRSLPEYLLLIDRDSVHDGQARVAEELALRLEADGVFVDQFYFQGDARLCRAPELPGQPLPSSYTLHELSARFPDHRLLVFSDGKGFFDPFTADPETWLEQFDYWQHRVLLTPESPAAWNYYEFTLAEQFGFVLIPAKITGLSALGELLNVGLLPELMPEQPEDDGAPFPPLAANDKRQMLDRRAPDADDVEWLVAQTKAYLGDDGWLWLMACAVYPQIRWEITLYLGGRLAQWYGTTRYGTTRYGTQSGSDGVSAERYGTQSGSDGVRSNPVATAPGSVPMQDWAESVLRLVRLPWFRIGRMPDWWRDRLIAEFTPEQERTVRQIVRDLLNRVTKHPDQPLTLEFAEPEPPRQKWQAFRQRLAARFNQWRERRNLSRLVQVQEDDSPLRDFVLLSFLAGHSRKRLGVNPPDLLRRILFNEGLAALGLRAATVSVAALMLSGALLFALWPKPPEKPIDDLLARNSPTPTVTPNETVTPTPAISPNVTPTPPVARTPRPTVTVTPIPFDPTQQTAPQGRGAFGVSQTPTGYSVSLGAGISPLEFVLLQGGQFTMGSNKGLDDEKPPHRVRLSAFSIGKYEITQAQWQVVMGDNPSYFKGDSNLPVESVTWRQANDFCTKLSEATGYNFRLPTEAEWEYACRAGTNTEYSFGDDEKLLGEYAWYSGNSGNKTHPVGTLKQNPFGLFDMHGNVFEWCSDWYGESYYAELSKQQGIPLNPPGPTRGEFRVLRGGSWGNLYYHRSANRHWSAPGGILSLVGFRVVLFARAP